MLSFPFQINKQFSYTDIYNANNNVNPFCDIILQIKNQFQESEAQLQHTVATRNNKVVYCLIKILQLKFWILSLDKNWKYSSFFLFLLFEQKFPDWWVDEGSGEQ